MKARKLFWLVMALVLLIQRQGFAAVSVNIVQGFNLISTPLDDDMGNHLSTLFPSVPDGTYVWLLNAFGTYDGNYFIDDSWEGPSPDAALPPGRGFWFEYPGANPPPIVFNGHLPTSTPPQPCGNGFCLVGLRQTTPGDFQQLMGYAPPTNAIVYAFIPGSATNLPGLSPVDPNFQFFRFDGTSWSPFAPTFEPGRGYFVATNFVPPRITVQPQSQFSSPGGTVTFSATVTGSELLLYQWRFNGVDLPGQTTNSLELTNVMSSQAGSYSLFVYNSGGSVTSAPAGLGVPPPFPDESFPPPWTRGPTSTTYQAWSLTNAASEQATLFNPRGQPVARPDGNSAFYPGFEGRYSVWNLQRPGNFTNIPPGRLHLAIPNYGDTNPTQLRLQIAFRGAPPLYSVYVPTGGMPAFQINGAPQRTARENGWTNELTVWEFGSSPLVQNILIQPPPGASTAIDQIIIDTISQPAPLPMPAPAGDESLTGPACLANGAFQFGFNGKAGVTYIAEYSADLHSWTPFQTNTATAPFDITDPTAALAPQRFYRVRVLGQ